MSTPTAAAPLQLGGAWNGAGRKLRLPTAGKPQPPAVPVMPQTQAPPAAPPPDPRDAAYTRGAGGLMQRVASARAEAQLAGDREKADLATTMRRMAEARAGDLKDANSGANRQGLFYSTVLGQRRGSIEKDYREREDDANLSARRREEDRAAALASLGEIVADPTSPLGYRGTGQVGLDLDDLYAEAIRRRLALDGDA